MTPEPSTLPHCGLLRRLAAIFYDSILLVAVLFLAASAALPITGTDTAANPIYTLYLLAVSFLFYGWFWTHGGQTLGMRAWRVRVQREDGSPLSWTDALFRFLGALLSWLAIGLGFAWSLFNPNKLAWHDQLSGTVLVVLPKQPEVD